MVKTLRYPAFGSELAVEVRHYVSKDKYDKFNLGLYAGLAYMRHPRFIYGLYQYNNSVGFVPGLKVAYKKRINSWLVGEPYVSISTPWYGENFHDMGDMISNGDAIGIVTIGIRIGLNKVKGMHDAKT